MERVERYRRPTRILHWIHSGAFLALIITGLILFMPGLGFLAEDSWTRIIHRVASVIFVAIPILYLIINPAAVGRGLKQAFSWGAGDMDWLKAAPRYYFLGDESSMPPQDSMNTGQKMWQLIVLITSILFLVSGLLMWFFKGTLAPGIFQWCVIVHDIAFVMAFLMLLVHIYLGVIHPRMTESLRSMWDGKISKKYARDHYGKWYDSITADKK